MIYSLSWGQLRRLHAKGPDDIVRVYTFQHPAAWEAARERGYLTGAEGAYSDPDFAVPYAWMRERMAERIPGFSGDMPVWAYLTRPNLRQRHHGPEPSVLVVADVPRGRMLLSDYDRWHQPLDLCYLVDTEAEMEALEEAGLQTYLVSRKATPEMMATWEGVFDLDHSGWSAEKLAYWRPPVVLQACVDRIHLSEVVRVRPVQGRVGRNRKPVKLRSSPVAGKASGDGRS